MKKFIDEDLQRYMEKTQEDMRQRCRENIEDINKRCAFGGESFSDHKERFEASKEYLRHGGKGWV